MKLPFKLSARGPRAPSPANVRLLPAAMASAAVVLGLKAVAVAQVVSQDATAPPAAASPAPAAQDGAATASAAQGQTSSQTPAQSACPAPSFADQAGLSQSEVQVLQALGARREALDTRSSEIDTQSQLLTAAQQRLDQRLSELHRVESTVQQLLGQLDEAQEHRLAGLVDVYQRMRAKDAATVFDGLDDGVLMQVASRMRQQNLADVMGKMQPARARRLTQMLADAARPPTDGQALLNRADGAPAPSGAGQ